jgi:hypothetical protein
MKEKKTRKETNKQKRKDRRRKEKKLVVDEVAVRVGFLSST